MDTVKKNQAEEQVTNDAIAAAVKAQEAEAKENKDQEEPLVEDAQIEGKTDEELKAEFDALPFEDKVFAHFNTLYTILGRIRQENAYLHDLINKRGIRPLKVQDKKSK